MVFLTKYHNQLPNIGKNIDDNWNHLHINAKISSAFTDKPIVAYKCNDNLRSLIGQHRISGNKVIRKKLLHKGKCTPCRTKRGNLCCQQVKETLTFMNRITKKGIQNIPPIKLQKQILYLPIRMHKMTQQTLCREIRNVQVRENKQPLN